MVNDKNTVSSIEAILGPRLLSKVGVIESTKSMIEGNDLVVLYFSASW